MNNTTSFFVLVFLALTFIMSAHDKLFHWNTNMGWMKPHFENTFLKKVVPLITFVLVCFELVSGILSLIGIVELYINGGRVFGFYGSVFSCITLLLMLFGQRLAKDFDGARTIAIYFMIAILGVFLLG